MVFKDLNHANKEVSCGMIGGGLGAVFEFALSDVFGFAETFPIVHSYLDTSGSVGVSVFFRNSGVAEDIGDDIHCTAGFGDIAARDAYREGFWTVIALEHFDGFEGSVEAVEGVDEFG